jgi:hypothetical protein
LRWLAKKHSGGRFWGRAPSVAFFCHACARFSRATLLHPVSIRCDEIFTTATPDRFRIGDLLPSFLFPMLLLVERQDPRLRRGHREQLAHHMWANALLIRVLTGECKDVVHDFVEVEVIAVAALMRNHLRLASRQLFFRS